MVDCSLLVQYYYYYSGGPKIPTEVYGRARSRTVSVPRRLSLDTSHYRTLSAVAGSVAAAAALAACPEPHPEHRVSRKHLTGQPLDETTPQVSEEVHDEVDDTVPPALSDSFHSGRKRVSWSQERHDHQSSTRSQVLPRSLRITSPQREHPSLALVRGRPEQREAGADEVEAVEVEVELAGSRAASRHRASSRASRRGAGMVLLGIGALFSIGALTNSRSRPSAERNDRIGLVLADEAIIPTIVSPVRAATYHESPPDAGVVVVEFHSTLSQNESRSQSQDSPSAERVIGRIFAWLCTSLYLTSRLPQIWKNVSLPFLLLRMLF